MLRNFLIYPATAFLILMLAATVYLYTGNKAKAVPDITISSVSLRLPAPGQTTAAVYFEILNAGGADELLSASSPVSANVELHNHVHENGIMKMRKLESLKIRGLQTTFFKPGGLHVMLFDFSIPANTTAIPLTLHFVRTGDVRVIAIIETQT
ncbi:MAG: hypothetical protein COA69_10355 [Robiginitomaculum sp.]|nr:MAG: hypothetical protein COA69_10355 [Robiginitomaculum sp.]